jgi:hypothetical protein
MRKGIKAAAAEAAVTVAEAIAVGDFEEANRLAAQFEALGGGALTLALAQEAEPGDHLRECWLAPERLCVLEARSINRAEILTARASAAAEAAEITAAEVAAAETAAAKAAAAVGGRRQSRRRGVWRASGLGARAAEGAWRRRGRHSRGRRGDPQAARV